ncbi:MAG: phosphate--acyl-ACP acyltransferase, partial [Bacteroidota bacterium]
AFYEVMAKHHGDDPFIKRLNFENHGATPVIGINKHVLIAHGISKAKAFKNMVISSAKLARSGLNEIIRQRLAENIVL